MADFKRCIGRTLAHEGGYTKNPNDKGNWTGGKIGSGECRGTKYGISAMSYPYIDIVNLTLDKAIEIYKQDFWDKMQGDLYLSDRIAWKVFDIGFNGGIKTAAMLLQEAVGATIDGVIGEHTLKAMSNLSEDAVLEKLAQLQRDRFIRLAENNPTDQIFLKGWLIRAEDIAADWT